MTTGSAALQAQPTEQVAPGTGRSGRAARTVVCLRPEDAGSPTGHEAQTQAWLAGRLARLLGCDYAGCFDPARHYAGAPYFVPNATVCPVEAAHGFGIRDEHDLFGGVVPFPFVATKAITHELVAPDAAAPPGWSREFGRSVRAVVLPGATAFSVRDARIAGERLLGNGSLRIKDPGGIGGAGQSVVTDRAALDAFLGAIDENVLAEAGLVLERNLREVTTASVGQVRVADLVASYFGTQRLTTDNQGRQVYGGSSLYVVRGDFDALLPHTPSAHMRTAVEQALVYHRAAFESFPAMFASRCNYDIAQGVDDEGRWHSAVLEQSWRMGGASAAELVALQAFRDDPRLTVVRACTTEVYGPDVPAPEGALVCCRGGESAAGPLTKYVQLEPRPCPPVTTP